MMIEYYACEIVVFGLDIKYNTGHTGILKITIKLSHEIIAYKIPPRTQNHHTHQYGNVCSQYHDLMKYIERIYSRQTFSERVLFGIDGTILCFY